MDRKLRYSRQGRAPKSRTSNACEACKRRKTKCSGGVSPCEVCKRADTFCNFNPKLDTRRKLAYNSTTIQDRQQFMLTALLQTIKHSREEDLHHLISLIRGPSRPDAVATSLRKQFVTLQTKGIIPLYDIDDTDVISFGLQGLCGHRKARPRPRSPNFNVKQDPDEVHSPTAMSTDSQNSPRGVGDENAFDDGTESRCSSPLSIGHEDLFDRVGNYDPPGLLDAAGTVTSRPQGFYPLQDIDTLPTSFFSPEEPASRSTLESPEFSQQTGCSTVSESSQSGMAHTPSAPTASMFDNGSEAYMSQRRRPGSQGFYDPSQPYPMAGPGSNHYMLQYYHALANGLPTTLDPTLVLKTGHQPMFSSNRPSHGAAVAPEDYNNPSYGYLPLRSNA